MAHSLPNLGLADHISFPRCVQQVQSLVARFQSAANRDAESNRRQSLPVPPRRSSSIGVSRPEEVKQPVTNGKSAHPENDAGNSSKVEKQSGEPGKDKSGKVKEKMGDVLEGAKKLAVGGGTNAKSSNDGIAEQGKTTTTSVTTTTTAKLTSKTAPPADKPTKSTTTNGVPTPINVSKTKTASVPSKVPGPKISPTSPTTSTRAKRSGSNSTTSPTTSTAPRTRLSSGPAKTGTSTTSTTTSHRKGNSTSGRLPQSSSTSRISSIAETTHSASKTPSTTRTTKLFPSMTGPPRRPATATGASSSFTPLKPQLTGAPSKPTASSLAKSLQPPEATEKRKSASLGKAAGTRLRRDSGSPSPAPGSVMETPVKSPPARASMLPSTSRLMQGTAASRARTSEIKSPPPSTTALPKMSPSKTKVNPSKAMVHSSKTPSKTTAANGGSRDLSEEPFKSPLKTPVGARLGLAAAVMGKGGNIGKENEEKNGRLRSGEMTLADAAKEDDAVPTDGSVEENKEKDAEVGNGREMSDDKLAKQNGHDEQDRTSNEHYTIHDTDAESHHLKRQAEDIQSGQNGLQSSAGARLGFAAAGLGLGGKTGKEYNEERNAKLRAGELSMDEIVAEGEAASSTSAPNQVSADVKADGNDNDHESEDEIDNVMERPATPPPMSDHEDVDATSEVNGSNDQHLAAESLSSPVPVKATLSPIMDESSHEDEEADETAETSLGDEGSKLGLEDKANPTLVEEDENEDQPAKVKEAEEKSGKGHARGLSGLDEIPDVA